MGRKGRKDNNEVDGGRKAIEHQGWSKKLTVIEKLIGKHYFNYLKIHFRFKGSSSFHIKLGSWVMGRILRKGNNKIKIHVKHILKNMLCISKLLARLLKNCLCIIVGQIDQLVRASLLGRGPEFISQHP